MEIRETTQTLSKSLQFYLNPCTHGEHLAAGDLHKGKGHFFPCSRVVSNSCNRSTLICASDINYASPHWFLQVDQVKKRDLDTACATDLPFLCLILPYLLPLPPSPIPALNIPAPMGFSEVPNAHNKAPEALPAHVLTLCALTKHYISFWVSMHWQKVCPPV